MLNKEDWSLKTFSWFYAGIIAFLIVLIAFLLLHFQRIKIINLRIIYVPIIFFGMMLFIYDYAKHTDKPIRYSVAFVNCFRTGIYMCILLLPIILIVLSIGLPKLGITHELMGFDEEQYQTGLLISMLVEIFASVFMASFVAIFVTRMVQNKE
jgi:hypothetical protein